MQRRISNPQRKVAINSAVVGSMQPVNCTIFLLEVMNMDIADRLQELRKKAGYSQEQVAEMLGLSRQAVSKWESGQGKPEIHNIVKLTEIYNVSADYILLGIENRGTIAVPEKNGLCHEYKKAISIIAIIAATALIMVLSITALLTLAQFRI